MRRLNLSGLVLLCALLSQPVPATLAQQGRSVATAPAAASANASASFTAEREAANRITAEQMKEYLYFIASDEMAGRDTPSPGLNATAKFIADKLARLKFKPMGDKGSYFQRIALNRTEIDRDKTRAELAGQTFKVGDDFVPTSSNSGEAVGQLVYVGHGWVIKSKNVNAYEGLDVKDKFMVVAGSGTSIPSGVAMRELKAGDWENPVSYAQRHGAKGIIFVPRNYERAWRYAARSVARTSYQVERLQLGAGQGDDEDSGDKPSTGKLLMIMPSTEMLDALFAGEQLDGAQLLQAALAGQPGKGFALSTNKRLRLSVQIKLTPASTQNVVAVLEGRDSKLRKEYVAFGAHYDHVGANGGGCRPVNGDSICNGADDDGSGTTALLTMAEAFARGPRPKRSILFVWHAGEEKGLWGSEYFTNYPTVPLKQIVAQLNIDMIGRSKKDGDTNPKNRLLTGPEEIYVIGSRMMSTGLADLNEQINHSYLNLKYNFHYDEPGDPERLFYRSDHFNYARKGIPIIFFFDGVHEDYHQPSDSPDKIDYQKMERVARTIFILGSELANAPGRPVIDKQIPASQLEQ
ncbi:MAG: M28 family peptidase [Acidobacteria bacterium]|nr:M28 family peptidase [Acidobacteriota bacterium]